MPKRRILRKVKRQTGNSNLVFDRYFKALAPGWRISNTGKKYYENRKNRSDLRKWL